MKFLVVGLGSIGCRHVRNLQSMGYAEIGAHDVDTESLRSRCSQLGIGAIHDFESELDGFDAVVVCSPPSSHVEVTLAAVRKGKYVFLEKPVSNDLNDARRLLDYEDRIMVGYNVRYHPLVAYVGEVLPSLGKIFNVQMEYAYSLENARPDANYRTGYYARRGEGGVLLDHIHEMDYAQHLFGRFSDVYCVAGKMSGLEIDSEDSADLILKNSQGFSLILHIDYVQQRYARSIKIVAERGVFVGDYAVGHTTLMLNGEEDRNKVFCPSFEQSYIDEMNDFVATVEGRKSPTITVASALHSLELAQAAHESNETGRVVSL